MIQAFKKMGDVFSDIKESIGNLIVWFPVIWKDRWWDHWFVYSMLHKKLSLMEQNIRHHGHHANAENDADKIKKCVLLLERLLKDEGYHEMAFKRHYEKWGEPQMAWKKMEGSDLVKLEITYPAVKNEEDKKQERKEFRIAMGMENRSRRQDTDMLFDLMKKHIQTWWD